MKRLALPWLLLAILVTPRVCFGQAVDTKSLPKTPNLVLDISGAAINAAVQQRVDRTEPVFDFIQDTAVNGVARTVGTVHAELTPDARQAVIDVVLRGAVHAQTVGRRPVIYIDASSVTPIDVRRRVVVDRHGIRTFAGPTFGATAIQLHDVRSVAEPDYLAMRVARQGFLRYQDLAEGETAWKTARQASDRLSQELSPPLSAASVAASKFLDGAVRDSVKLEAFDLQTTTSALQARLRFATIDPSPTGAVPDLPSDIDLGLRVHQSLLNEAARKKLSGKTFLVTEISKLYDESTQGLLADGRKDPSLKDVLKSVEKLLAEVGGKNATISMAKDDPMTITFGAQSVSVQMKVATIRLSDKDVEGMRVRTAYRFENSRQGVVLVRDGALQFLPLEEPTDKKMAPQPPAFLLLREILFAEVLKERLIGAIPLAEAVPNVTFSPLRAGARDGWLGLGWTVAPKESRTK